MQLDRMEDVKPRTVGTSMDTPFRLDTALIFDCDTEYEFDLNFQMVQTTISKINLNLPLGYGTL